MCRIIFIFTLLLLFHSIEFSFPSFGQSIGNARDGSMSIGGVINKYSALTGIATRCDDFLPVQDASLFKQDELILIIQMQGAVIDGSNTSSYGAVINLNNAGVYEFAEIKNISADTLYIKYALLNTYLVSGRTQVIAVPQYEKAAVTATLTCPGWDGNTGGVIILDAKTISMEAGINCIGKGFNGGEVNDGEHIMLIKFEYFAELNSDYYSRKGEGIAFYGNEPYIAGRGASANGGGGGNIHTTGGGGGAHGGSGGNGGWGYPIDTAGNEKLVYGIGGYAVDYSAITGRVFMGGGGGSGHEHNGNGTSGASGGGIVLLMCDTLLANGKNILANGGNSASSGAYGDGTGGAGGGGSILLAVNSINGKLNADARGGNGGSSILKGFGPGGGGGGGIVRFSSIAIADSVNTLLDGGDGGLAGGKFYGALPGATGITLPGIALPFNKTIPAVHADFTLSPADKITGNDYRTANTTINFTNYTTGNNTNAWNFGDSKTDSASNPTHEYSSTGTYTVMLLGRNQFCSDTAVKTLLITFEMPNVFSPNGDGVNDLFPGVSIGNFEELMIFNRWGETVFRSNEVKHNWDGKIKNGNYVTEGTYFYVLKFKGGDWEEVERYGTVLLVR